MFSKLGRARLRGLLLATGIVFGFMIVFAGVTNLDDLVLSGYLTSADSLSTNGNLRVTGTAAITGAITQTGAATFDSKVSADSFLVLGSTTYINGGYYINVQNKSGQTLRVGEVVQWDNTNILLTQPAGDSTSLTAAIGALAAEGTGWYSFKWLEDGTNPSNDTLFITGTSPYGTAQVDTLAMNGGNDTTCSAHVFRTVTAMSCRSIAGTSDVIACPLMGVTIGVVQANGDSLSSTIYKYAGVVYPSTIADNAWGTILVEGTGKVLAVGLDLSLEVGTPLDVDADSAGIASAAVLTNHDQLYQQLGYAMQMKQGSEIGTPTLIWAYINLR